MVLKAQVLRSFVALDAYEPIPSRLNDCLFFSLDIPKEYLYCIGRVAEWLPRWSSIVGKPKVVSSILAMIDFFSAETV